MAKTARKPNETPNFYEVMPMSQRQHLPVVSSPDEEARSVAIHILMWLAAGIVALSLFLIWSIAVAGSTLTAAAR